MSLSNIIMCQTWKTDTCHTSETFLIEVQVKVFDSYIIFLVVLILIIKILKIDLLLQKWPRQKSIGKYQYLYHFSKCYDEKEIVINTHCNHHSHCHNTCTDRNCENLPGLQRVRNFILKLAYNLIITL